MRQKRLLDCAAAQFPEEGRDQLYARILCGELSVNGERVADPNRLVDPGAKLELRAASFVSRGRPRLEYALSEWLIDVTGRVYLDAGASTGGFTDCLLRRGAAFVHCVDTGYNQLAYVLRRDRRVGVHERTNVLDLQPGALDPAPTGAVADLSLRSLVGVAGRLLELTGGGAVIALLKPQYELFRLAPEATVGFGGVVRDEASRDEAVDRAIEGLAREGAYVTRRIASPIRGRKGNVEYLVLIERNPG